MAEQQESISPPLRSGELAGISAGFAEGYARIREVVDHDGACPAWAKALYVAAAACVKGHEEMMRAELGRAVSGGLSHAHARGACIALLISRGEAVYERFKHQVDAEFGPHRPGEDPSVGADANVGDARAYFKRYFGEVPDYIEIMADHVPRALEGYYLMRESSLEENPLPWKHVELLLMAVNAADLNQWYVSIHALGARNAGASDDEIAEAVVCAIPVAGVASWLAGAAGVDPQRS